MKFLTNIKRSEWATPFLLVLLSLIPAIAGSFRVHQLSNAVVATETIRFYKSLSPVILHIIASLTFSLLGAFQFSAAFRKRNPKWHKVAGRILVVAGLTVSLTGIWMTLIYDWAEFDGAAVYFARLAVGIAMTLFIIYGVDAIRKKQYEKHGEWMIRAYAIAMGAGTQVLTHLPWVIFPNSKNEFSRSVFMISAWVINMIVAEWIIRKPNLNFKKTATLTNQ